VTIGVVTMFRDEAPYLGEWITYHRLVGATRFWLFDHGSTDNWRDVVAPHLADGTVEVIPAPGAIDLQQRRQQQVAIVKDGIRRARGTVDWVAHIDVDEFILPMRDATLEECLRKRYSDASGVYANWRMFGTSGVIVPTGDPILTQLTACSRRKHGENSVGKSIVRPEDVLVDEVWYVHHFPVQTGARYLDGDGHELSFNERKDLVKRSGHFDEHVRINHYNLRDERFYQTRRLPQAIEGRLNKNVEQLREHYASFGKTEDHAIVDFLKKHHASAYKAYWRKK
jgi:hypothetical protein